MFLMRDKNAIPRAIRKIILDLCIRELKRIAFDANLHDMGIETPVAIRHAKRREEIKALMQFIDTKEANE